MKFLVAGGCSNTAGVGFEDYTWAFGDGPEVQSKHTWAPLLAEKMEDTTIINVGEGGCSNDKIIKNIINKLTDIKDIPSDNIKVGIMWTYPDRYDLFNPYSGRCQNMGHWEPKTGNKQLDKAAIVYRDEILSINEMQAHNALKNIHYMQMFLVSKNIDYFFTHVGSTSIHTLDTFTHFTDLHGCDIYKDLINWEKFIYAKIPYVKHAGLEDIGRANNYRQFDCGHYGHDTHIELVNKYLYPELKKRNFL